MNLQRTANSVLTVCLSKRGNRNATFSLEKTLDEIYSLYRTALGFVEELQISLRECDEGLGKPT